MKNNVKSLINEINEYSKMMKEGYIFDEDDLGYDEGMPDKDMENDSEDSFEGQKEDSSEIIDKIRSIALHGIEQYADNVKSDEYNVFKNIWMSCDKYSASKDKDLEGEE